MMHPSSSLDSVIYLPNNRKIDFISKEAKAIHLWKDGQRTLKIDISRPKEKDQKPHELMGLSKWMYVEQLNLIIATNNQSELMVRKSSLTNLLYFYTHLMS